MTRIRYGVAPWLDRSPKTKGSYPALSGEMDVPVAIVGGGLAGVATAYACAAGGVRVALVEADRVGRGATGRGAGLLLQAPTPWLVELQASLGVRAAKAIWSSWRRAALDLASTIRRLNIRCGLAPVDVLTWAQGPEAAKVLDRELAARRGAGFEATAVTARALARLGVHGARGIRTRGAATLDPARLAEGLARAAARRGAMVFERSRVEAIELSNGRIAVGTGQGTVHCETVVVATGEPTVLFRPLARHVASCETYMVQTPPLPAAVRSAIRDRTIVLQDCQQPPHHLAWTGDRILWSGADQARTPPRAREKTLVQRTGQLMYELSLVLPEISGVQPEYGWDAPYSTGRDRLPLVGPHRNYPRHLFAFGLGVNPAAAFLASRVFLRRLTGRASRADDFLGFTRSSR